MNKTTFVAFFTAKIIALLGLAMGGLDVVQHRALRKKCVIFLIVLRLCLSLCGY